MSHPGLYFAGTLQHSRDFRKSSGGVLDGFRYLVRAMHHQMEQDIEGVPFPVIRHENKDMSVQVGRHIN